MVVLADANNKGGVGKTTTTHNLAHMLSEDYEMKVLVIDMDQQQNITQILAPKLNTSRAGTAADIFRYNAAPDKVISETRYEHVLLIPASNDLVDVENELAEKRNNHLILKQWIAANTKNLEKEHGIDVVIIDCAPDVGNIEQNAFEASDTIIIVISPDSQALRGLVPFAKRLAMPVSSNKAVILYNEVDDEDEVSREITDYLQSRTFKFKKHLIRSYIPRHPAIKKSVFKECKPIGSYDEGDFVEEELNPYTQYVGFVKELFMRGVLDGK